jgi:ELWxxDGT repeat protein
VKGTRVSRGLRQQYTMRSHLSNRLKSLIVSFATLCLLTQGPVPVAKAGMIGQSWLESVNGVTSNGVYLSRNPLGPPYQIMEWFYASAGKITSIPTSRKSLSRSWSAKRYRYHLSGNGGMALWASNVVSADSTGWGGNNSAIWVFQGASAKRIALNTVLPEEVVVPVGQSAGRGYWLQSGKLMTGKAGSPPSQILLDDGIAVNAVYDLGGGNLLASGTTNSVPCTHLMVISPIAVTSDSTCAPTSGVGEFVSLKGKVFYTGGLVYNNGLISSWRMETLAGGNVIAPMFLGVGDSDMFFVGLPEASSLQWGLYAYNGSATRQLASPIEGSYVFSTIANRPYLLYDPPCSDLACEKNRSSDVLDLSGPTAVKVATATIGWANYYDIPSYPYCVACRARFGMVGFKGKLYFSKAGSSGVELYRYDPKTKKTTLFKNIRPGVKSSFPFNFMVAGGWMYFFADSDGRRGPELWATDGSVTRKLLEGE